MALLVICEPQVGPTCVRLLAMFSGVVWVSLAMATSTLFSSACLGRRGQLVEVGLHIEL